MSFAFSLLFIGFYPQSARTDSLKKVLETAKEDTNQVNALNDLGWSLMFDNQDTAILLAGRALIISEKLQWKKGSLNTLSNLGVYYWLKSEYPKALEHYFKALNIAEELGDKKKIVPILGNIANVYYIQANYSRALSYYLEALKIAEKLQDKNKIAVALGNIGNVYNDQANYAKALDYYFQALRLNEEAGHQNNMSSNLGNIGTIYMEQGEYAKALPYYFRALKLARELDDKNGIARHLGNIGIVYKEQADSTWAKGDRALAMNELYPKALAHYFDALKMDEELGSRKGVALNLGNIGALYTRTGKFREAEMYLLRSLAIYDSIGALEGTKAFEEVLSRLYDTTGRTALAFLHYKKYIAARDSMNSEEEQKRQVRAEMNYAFEKKEAAIKAAQDVKDAQTKAEAKKQRIILFFVLGSLLLVVVFTGFIFRSLRITQKQKKIIEEARNEIAEQKEVVEKQKELVEEKQKEILDSIRYAKRIQQSLLTNEKYIERHLKASKRGM